VSPSLFEGLSLTRAGRRIDITYPRAIRDFALAREAGLAHGVDVLEEGPQAWRVAFEHDARYPAALKAFFARLNDHVPPRQAGSWSLDASGAQPLVSCVVVVHENLPFVLEQFLPWLAASSQSHALEVILVLNGERELEAPPGMRVVRSPWGAVSAAYNVGAAASRGDYLAFFHDDCMVLDPLWIQKCLQRLERGAGAVAGEYRQIAEVGGVAVPPLPVAKCVPLFLRKSDFEQAGGFDERHYIGYEDLDFTLALAACGKKLVATDLQILHFNGMSSTLKYNPVPGLADLYALGAVPRFAVMRRFKEFWRTGLVRDGVDYMQAGMDAQLLYLLRKYATFLGGHGREAYASAAAALEGRIQAACPAGPDAALACLRELDREVAGFAQAPA
jgi:glycosyltransferase involved in cell wall biosynthesis